MIYKCQKKQLTNFNQKRLNLSHKFSLYLKKKKKKKNPSGRREDGRRVRRRDHLPSHRYSRNTSTRGTAPTEHPLNAGRKRPTSKKARNSPRTWVGQKKKEITETKE